VAIEVPERTENVEVGYVEFTPSPTARRERNELLLENVETCLTNAEKKRHKHNVSYLIIFGN
jgi:hypothetical protein